MTAQRFETVNGSYVVHMSEGRGRRTSMFLHGGPGLNSAPERAMCATELERAGPFIWCDLLGSGESTVLQGRLTWDAHVEDAALIARRFGNGPVNLVGHCLGVDIVHELVCRHRDIVASAVWISPATDLLSVLQHVIGRACAEDRLTGLEPDRQRAVDRFLSIGAADCTAADVMLFLELAGLAKDFWSLYWSDSHALEAWLRVMEGAPFSPEAFVALSVDYLSRPGREVPDYAGIPVQVLHSSQDQVTRWDRHGAVLARKLPHTEIHEIDGGGHFIHLQKPKETAERIRGFLTAASRDEA